MLDIFTWFKLLFTFSYLWPWSGVGLGCMLLPSYVCVIQHFNKRRSLANGVASCGSGNC